MQALDRYLGKHAEVLGDRAGLHVTVRLRTKLPDEELVRRAVDAGVGISTSGACYLGRPRKGELVLAYGALEAARIEEGVRRLAAALGMDGW